MGGACRLTPPRSEDLHGVEGLPDAIYCHDRCEVGPSRREELPKRPEERFAPKRLHLEAMRGS